MQQATVGGDPGSPKNATKHVPTASVSWPDYARNFGKLSKAPFP